MGLKRGLADIWSLRLTASALALMVAPEEACLNLQRLVEDGWKENTAYMKRSTALRHVCRGGQSSVVVRSFMAHHQGMIFLSLAYLLLDRPMQKRFESDPSSRRPHSCSRSGFQRPRRSIGTLPSSPTYIRFRTVRRRRCAFSTVPTRRTRRSSCYRTAGIT